MVVVGSWRDGNILFCSSVFIMVLFILWLKRFETFLQSNMQEPLLNIENAYCQQLQTLTLLMPLGLNHGLTHVRNLICKTGIDGLTNCRPISSLGNLEEDAA